jgi:tritrans,polycis-undecaprenyl-diphosphate synthase [geranylgeranyl-diphosphate specific]
MSLKASISDVLSNTAYSTYESKLEKEVLSGPMPQHVAIIMDGNRRYAREILKSEPNAGHVKGKEKMEEVLNWCLKVNVKVLTVYAFSTENFNRGEDEVDFLLELIRTSLMEYADDPRIHEKRVRIKMIGDESMLPQNVLDAAKYAEEKTKDYSDFQFNIAVAYGGRQEIVNAVKEVARKVQSGEMKVDDITEESLSNNMYTADVPDPDLVLRTSGELRISNFLLWQLAYSEFYFTDVYWPGFRYIDFLRAIRSYQQRKRRYGK